MSTRLTQGPGRRILVTLVALATTLVGALAQPGVALAEPLTIYPRDMTVEQGNTQQFKAFFCDVDGDGQANVGPDGIPGTADDLCTPVAVNWLLFGSVGSLSPASGTQTTFLATMVGLAALIADLPGTGTAAVSVFVVPPATPPPPPPPPQAGRLAFTDSAGQETTELSLLRLGLVPSIFLAELTSAIARREARGGQATRAELRLLRSSSSRSSAIASLGATCRQTRAAARSSRR